MARKRARRVRSRLARLQWQIREAEQAASIRAQVSRPVARVLESVLETAVEVVIDLDDHRQG